MLKNLSIPHDKVFKSTTHKKLKNLWPYMEDPISEIQCKKGANGKVTIGKKNFIGKEGWHTRKYKYMADPYDREERMRRVRTSASPHFLARATEPQGEDPAPLQVDHQVRDHLLAKLAGL
jgi:hypothetical protein